MWAAIIVAVTLLGRWAFSVDTYAQEGVMGRRPTVTPTSLLDEEGDSATKEKRERRAGLLTPPAVSGRPAYVCF